jgi:indolepyruvate ferredoxin oxidoreductase beta subunit
MKDINLIICGVGGQGIILASDILAEVAIDSGYDVKKTDTLGMAQRGGSVISHIRMGNKIYSPMIKKGQADIVLGFEKLEALRWSQYLNDKSIVIVNNYKISPSTVNLGKASYPDDEKTDGILKEKAGRVISTNGTEYAINLGDIRVLNIFLIGCASVFLPFKIQVWMDTILRRLPSKVASINKTAFDKGREEIENGSF